MNICNSTYKSTNPRNHLPCVIDVRLEPAAVLIQPLDLSAAFFPLATAIAGPLVGMAWAIFAICRYLKMNAAVKTGACFTAVGILSGVLSHATAMSVANTSITGVTFYSDPWLVLMLSIGSVGLIIAGIGALVGMFKGGKKNENK